MHLHCTWLSMELLAQLSHSLFDFDVSSFNNKRSGLSVGRLVGMSTGQTLKPRKTDDSDVFFNPFWAAAPKGPMTYAVFIWASRMELGPWAGIAALRLGLGPWGWDLSFKARFWASRMDLRLKGVDGEGEGGEGKISPMCESIGHRIGPFGAAAQKVTNKRVILIE